MGSICNSMLTIRQNHSERYFWINEISQIRLVHKSNWFIGIILSVCAIFFSLWELNRINYASYIELSFALTMVLTIIPITVIQFRGSLYIKVITINSYYQEFYFRVPSYQKNDAIDIVTAVMNVSDNLIVKNVAHL